MGDRIDIAKAAATLQKFYGSDLTQTLAALEAAVRGADITACVECMSSAGANSNVLAAAALMKQLAGQINVVIHALGILLCLPHLLEEGEVIEYVSLGAGNTGRRFDLETNRRIAEFKFIRWQGGPEAIRQNSLFKDFYLMAEELTHKRKYLYVLETKHPLKFFYGGRALSSVLSRNVKLQREFLNRHGEKYPTVRDYYIVHKDKVVVEDVSKWVPGLAEVKLDDEQSED